ncbi:MAG: PilN domain-containing protein [Bacillota bacterium]
MTAIDLLPREIKERTRRRRVRFLLALLACALVGGLVVARGELTHQVRAWEDRLARVEAERARLGRLADKKAEVGRLEQLLSQARTPSGTVLPPWGELLWFLARVTPPEVMLQELRWDGATLHLSGQAADLAAVGTVVRALEGCPYLDRVALAQVTRGEEKGFLVFTVTAAWRGSK